MLQRKPRKRIIRVYEDDKEVYKGDDRRAYDEDYPHGPKIFGLPMMDLIKIALYIGGVIVFLVKADQRLNSLENNQQKMSTVLDRLVTWTENSDSFNSAQYGTQFQNGRPLNDRFIEWNKRSNQGGKR